MAKKRVIHVNQHKIRSNRKHGRCEPVLTVKTYNTRREWLAPLHAPRVRCLGAEKFRASSVATTGADRV